MYAKSIPYTNFNGKPGNRTVHFNLTAPQVFKLVKEFNLIFRWRDSLEGPERNLDTDEVLDFYNAFEEILLSAYGIPSQDGESFDHADRYEFEKTALFAAAMMYFLQDPDEANKLIDGLMPKDLQAAVEKAGENLDKVIENPKTPDDQRALYERLREQYGES